MLAHGAPGAVPAGDRRVRACSASSRAWSCGCGRASKSAASWRSAKTTDIIERFEERIRDGYLYGDYQFATDAHRDSFLRRGVFSCYQPVPDRHAAHRASDALQPRGLGAADVLLAHAEAARVRGLFHALPGDLRTDLLGGLAAVGGLRGQLSRRSRSRARRPGAGHRDDHRNLRAAVRAARVHAGSARAAARAAGEHDLRHRAHDREGRRDVSGVGARPVRLRHLQPARRSHAGGHRARRGDVPGAHRPRHRARRQLLSDLSPLGAPGSGRARVIRRCAEFLALKRRHDPGRSVPEHLVPSLPRRCSDHRCEAALRLSRRATRM